MKIQETIEDILYYEEPYIGFYGQNNVDIKAIVDRLKEKVEDVAIRFVEWIKTDDQIFEKWSNNKISEKELFNEFIKNYYDTNNHI